MKKRKKNKIFIGGIIILTGIILFFYENTKEIIYKTQETENIQIFFDSSNTKENKINEENYIMVLSIPKINLEKGVYKKESEENDVSKNIEMLEESNLPDEKYGNLILAAHSGNSYYAHFKDLEKLELDDEIKIHYEENLYTYKIKKIFKTPKTGTINLEYSFKDYTITLITCTSYDDEQLVIIAQN